MKGRRVRQVISGFLVGFAVTLGACGAGWARVPHRVHAHHHRTGLAAHLCASHDAVIATHGHKLRAIGRRRYFAPIGQAMYYRDMSRRCQLRRTAHRRS
ncbi:hypothetical protein AAC691_22150 [Nguyenibacter vanlangensis]|uniref:Lipoprotein n=1 Tax=Nguyenibacter vanlangensis TaxID=1216886 RepID=A0A7Y7IXD8_9PROT|nr:hypothetical protein [Nguyenibacter vanlangensis]NVN11596.1 hypothetical protein [Nguyenibacter vanlangensis]